ncbi:MAG TPA: hypothetical protein VH575_21110 [Gemmataceae bacterium]|jgi:hypothetical protein
MIQAMIWKEYREHRVVWLALAIVGAAGLFGLSKLMAPESITAGSGAQEMLQAVAAILAWAYGLVCGAILLAGEREMATLTFLDLMPVRRLQLWLVKCLFGLVLFLAQVAVLGVVVVGLGIAQTVLQMAGTVLAMLLVGLFGMVWALFFSARGENVLNVIGLAIVGQIGVVIAAFCLSFLAVLVWQIGFVWIIGHPQQGDLTSGSAFVVLVGLTGGGLTLAAIAGSARIFSQPDQQRGRRQGLLSVPKRPEQNVWASWGRLLWLSYLQMRRLILGMVLFGLGLGFLVPATGPVVWPAFTLLIGVLCGVTVFGDEQLHGSFRFLGDQRFPLGRVWFVKVALRFALAVFAAFLLLLPNLILSIAYHEMHSPREERMFFFGAVLHSVLVGPVVPAGIHLTMWLLYGFTVGHLCGLLFRKSLVAGVVSLGAAAMLASLWVPSLLGMGLHFWQVAGVPLILLATARLLMPAWAADRLAARRIFLGLGAALAAVGLWTAGGLWYRVAEVPDVPDRFDMPAFIAQLPSMDDNEGGRATREAWRYVEPLTRFLAQTHARQPLFPDLGNTQFDAQVGEVLQRGWPDGPSDLGDWLDRYFQGADAKECLERLTKAADCPVGPVEDVRYMTIDDRRLDRWGNAVLFNQALAARGLQLQTRGDRKTFVDYLRIGLALSRDMQTFAPPEIVRHGRAVEKVWSAALDHWLEELQGPPEVVSEQLKRVATILRQHDDELPDETTPIKVAYLIALNSLHYIPGNLLDLAVPRRSGEEDSMHQAELDAASLMWRIPWEQERHQRILRALFEGDLQQIRQARECGELLAIHFGTRSPLASRSKRDLARLRAVQLQAALRWYQAETGKLPQTLDALVPHYLAAIPLDPFDNKPFRYRLSRGEEIGWVDVEIMVPPGAPGMAGAPGMPVAPPGMAGAPGMPGAAPGMPGAAAPAMPAVPPGVPVAPGMPAAAPPVGMPGAMPGMFGVPQMPKRVVPDGQGILWAVGEDGHDDGGVKQGKDSGTMFGEDVIFLVPPPPE